MYSIYQVSEYPAGENPTLLRCLQYSTSYLIARCQFLASFVHVVQRPLVRSAFAIGESLLEEPNFSELACRGSVPFVQSVQ